MFHWTSRCNVQILYNKWIAFCLTFRVDTTFNYFLTCYMCFVSCDVSKQFSTIFKQVRRVLFHATFRSNFQLFYNKFVAFCFDESHENDFKLLSNMLYVFWLIRRFETIFNYFITSSSRFVSTSHMKTTLNYFLTCYMCFDWFDVSKQLSTTL